MTKQEARQLPLGLYRIYWKRCNQTSLAAIGMLNNGDKWLAPINWTHPTDNQNIWRKIEKVEKFRIL